MKKLLVIFCLLSLTGWGQYIDYYDRNNANDGDILYSGVNISAGQSFSCSENDTLYSVTFLMYGSGTGGEPTGTAYAKLYTHSGTYGSTSVPTGSALATSDGYDVADLSKNVIKLVSFKFTGANRKLLTSGTKYIIQLYYNGGSVTDRVGYRIDTSTPSHSGNKSASTNESTWSYVNTQDVVFYVYGTTQIKKIAGVLDANTKRVAGVADASIKKISGKTK